MIFLVLGKGKPVVTSTKGFSFDVDYSYICIFIDIENNRHYIHYFFLGVCVGGVMKGG